MLLYIIHSNKIYPFSLPKIISGTYMIEDYDLNGSSRNLVNVSARDSKWIMSSNENVRILSNNQYIDECELSLYGWYALSTVEGEKILIYVMPSYEKNYITKCMIKDGIISVGSNSKSDIVFSNNVFGDRQLEIIYNDSHWHVKNLNAQLGLYINNVKVLESDLNNLDKIFIAGLIIIVCGNLIFISGSNNSLTVSSDIFGRPERNFVVADYNSVFQNYTDFYNVSDYFSKSPVFLKKINTFQLEIQPPEEKEKPEYQSIFLTMVPTALMSVTTLITTYYAIKSYNSGDGDEETLYTTVVMLIVMFIIAFIWPFVERFAEKISYFLKEKYRVRIYERYLKQKRDTLEKIASEQKTALFFNNLSLEECQKIILNRSANLFSLNAEQEQFLKVRLGTGRVLLNCNYDYKKPDFVKYKDNMQTMLDALLKKYKYIENAPLTFSLKESIAFINGDGDFNGYLESLVLQIAALHDYYNVKLVFLTSDSSILNFSRNLNHCWNDEKDFRYVATNLQDAETLSSELMKVYSKRLSDENSFLPYYVIICDDINKYRNLQIIDQVIHKKEDKGFSLVSFVKRITDVPDGCSYFCDYSSNSATLFKNDMEEDDIVTFVPEFADKKIDFSKCISRIADIPVKSNIDSVSSVALPEKLGFLEMYNVGNVNQLNSADRWKNSQIVNSLSAPIGIDTTGNILNLDLHEKKHGPHGLVAGMTGSGKSETIITYLLSLAVNYSPDEVQFVLIDYKGGGLAGAFENRKAGFKLPHLVGTITNLDTAEMNRTLVSIKSELQRRQKVFNKAKEELNTGTIDIYKYQGLVRDGQIKEPLSHLFIVCDEFAELRQQQPDFMDEIVSAARIGRSLGIHLILATQKPTGVVDDQVWSNSKFKICCKVQTAEDSVEMLRKPDAAYIKESGRFYLQIGYDEYYILAQSGYSGTEYVPSDRALPKLDNNISFVNSLGEIYKNVVLKVNNDKQMIKKDSGVELTNIVRYLIEVAKNGNYKYHQLWLDNIPEVLLYKKTVLKYQYVSNVYDINPVIGEYDDPERQSQGLVTLPLTFGGNTYIVGMSGSGKCTLLSTIISSTIINHNSDEVNIYIIDMGAEKLKQFAKAPQVGDVLTISDADEIKFLIFMLQLEMSKRQRYYSNNGSDFLLDVKNKKCPFPNILVFIYDIDLFKETFEYLFDEMISPITRNSAKYGIYFIVTGNTAYSLGYSAEQYFSQKIMLNVSDPADYGEFFEKYPVIKKNPGRGVVKVADEAFEFQTCLFSLQENEMEVLDTIIKQLNIHLKTRAKPVPRIPSRVVFDDVSSYITNLSSVPIGIDLTTAQLAYYNFDNLVNVISSERVNSFVKFISGFQQILLKIPNTKIIILNAFDDLKVNVLDSVKIYSSNFVKVTSILKNNILKYNELQSDEKFIIIVLNYDRLNLYLKRAKKTNESLEEVFTISDLVNLSKNNNFRFVLYDLASNSDELKKGDICDYFDGSCGLWIGNNIDEQMLFEISGSTDFGILNDEVIIKIDSGGAEAIKSVRQ